MNTVMIGEWVWIFGRGASIACGAAWEEPETWKEKDRHERIQNINRNLAKQMRNVPVGRNPYSHLLFLLEHKTTPNQKSLFITTNWDYLLQREIDSGDYDPCPRGSGQRYVWHLNGSIKKGRDSRYCSPIILPEDDKRTDNQEFSWAMNQIVCERLFIIVGMSFQCKADEKILRVLRPDQNKLPFGEGRYLIVNNSAKDLERLESVIKSYFPRVDIIKEQADFKSWIDEKRESIGNFEPFGVLTNFPYI